MAQSSATFTIALDPAILAGLAPGSYQEYVKIASGTYESYVPVIILVSPPMEANIVLTGALVVPPVIMAPFVPLTAAIHNQPDISAPSISISAISDVPWASVSVANPVVAPGGNTPLTITIDPVLAAALPAGKHPGIVSVTITDENGYTSVIDVPVTLVSTTEIPPSVLVGKLMAPYADITQQMANSFPDWHSIRLQKESLAHQVLNNITGIPATELLDEVENFSRQSSVSLANPAIGYKEYEIDIAHTVIRPKRRNLLLNSNFAEWTNPSMLPDYWKIEAERYTELYTNAAGCDKENYLGGRSLIIASKSSPFIAHGKARIYQEYVQPAQSDVRTWQAFCYYKRDGITNPVFGSKSKLFIKLIYNDNSTNEQTTSCSDVSEWTKIRVTATATRRVAKIQVGILSDDILNSDSLYYLRVSNFMLHNSFEQVPWCMHTDDTVYPLPASRSDYCVIATSNDSTVLKRHVLYEIPNGLTKSVMPDSIAFNNMYTPTVVVSPEVQSPLFMSDAYMPDRTAWLQSIAVSNDITCPLYDWPTWTKGRIIKFSSNNPKEIYATYKPAFRSTTEVGKMYNANTVYITAIEKFNNKYWIVAKFLPTSLSSFTTRYTNILLIADTVLPKQLTDLDEEGVDLENEMAYIPIVRSYLFDITGGASFSPSMTPSSYDVYKMDFEEGESVVMHMPMGFKARFNLLYNYFTVDETNKKVYTLRNYTLDNTSNVVVVC